MKTRMVVILMLCMQFVFGQNSLGKFDLSYDASLSTQARSLSIPPNLGIGDYRFHTRVGGVSFQTIAQPADNLKGQIVSVDYLNNQFVVKVGSQTFYPELPNWQLIPIANFANTSDKAVFTIYGENIGDGGAQCRYHPAFLDNLLGLRLFQADILLPSPNIKYLMKSISLSKTELKDDMQSQITKMRQEGYSENDIYNSFALIYRLSKGENLPRNNYIDVMVDFMHELQNASEQIFDISNDENSSNDMWKLPEENGKYIVASSESTDVPRNINKLKEIEDNLSIRSADIQSVMIKKVHEKYQNLSIVEQQAKLQEYFEQLFSAMFFQRQYILTDYGKEVKFSINQNKFQLSGKPYYLFSVIDYDNKTVTNLYKESEMYNESWDLLKQYNPAVITAVENTMQWSAFFRYIKKTNPNNWNEFMKKMPTIPYDAPDDVKTPTRFCYKNDEDCKSKK